MYVAEDPGPGPRTFRSSLLRGVLAAGHAVFWYLFAPLAIALTFVAWFVFALHGLWLGLDFRVVLVTMPFVVSFVLLAARRIQANRTMGIPAGSASVQGGLSFNCRGTQPTGCCNAGMLPKMSRRPIGGPGASAFIDGSPADVGSLAGRLRSRAWGFSPPFHSFPVRFVGLTSLLPPQALRERPDAARLGS